MTIKSKVLLRTDTLSNWTSANPTLSSGELAIVHDDAVCQLKIGNGISSFNQLPFLYQQEFKTEILTSRDNCEIHLAGIQRRLNTNIPRHRCLFGSEGQFWSGSWHRGSDPLN